MENSAFFEAMTVASTALIGIAGALLIYFITTGFNPPIRDIVPAFKISLGISMLVGIVTTVVSLATLKVLPVNLASWQADVAWALFAAQGAGFVFPVGYLLFKK